MYRPQAVLIGILAGAVGALIWAGIAYATGYEIGWIAWGIGILVGGGVLLGNGGQKSRAAGVIGALIAVFAVAGGKYGTVRLTLPSDVALIQSAMADLDETEFVMTYVADEIAREEEASGAAIAWPAGTIPYQGVAEADYPANIWAAAVARWESWPADERKAYSANIMGALEESLAGLGTELATAGFLSMFGLMDLLFFGLAVVTAFKISSAGTREGDGQPAEVRPAA